MTLIKTSLLSGIAVIIKMLTLLSLNKVLAIYVGPSGYATIGQFQNAVQMITAFASGAINTGVTKYTAEYYDNESQQHKIWRTAGTISLIGSILTAVLIVIFSHSLAASFLNDESLSSVFIWFAATLVLFVFNTLLLAILNGKKEIGRYVFANISGSLFSLVVTTALAIRYGLYGALVALAIYQSLTFVITLLLTYRAPWFRLNQLMGAIDRKAVKCLGKYTAMALTTAVCVPLSHILIRDHIGETLGWNAAGYWEAMWRLSGAYLMLITTTLGVYYLPRLSELKTNFEVKNEIVQGYKIILPVAAALSLFIYLARDPIVGLLFTDEFSDMKQLFAWQMVGDTLKIGSWILAYVMLGKAMTKLFICSEIFSAGLFYILTILFTDSMGLQGVAVAHAVNYFVYWLVMMIFISFSLKRSTV